MVPRTSPVPPVLLALALAAIPAGACAQELRGLEPPTLLRDLQPDADDLDMRRTPVVRAVERAADSVVSVYVMLEDGDRRPDRERVGGQGSGVIIDEAGLVITNWHVIAPVATDQRRFGLQVRLKSGKAYKADLLSSSADHDLALLSLQLGDGERVVPVVAGDSDSLMVGETVIAIGNPQGHANTVTVGVLSAIDRSIDVVTPDGVRRAFRGLLQTDAAINQGNSGGALLDITGKLVGINNAMAAMAENIGFAMPVNTVRKVFQDVLLSSENLANVWLGMKVKDVDGLPVVADVTVQGPAERAGLRQGDVVQQVAGEPVHNPLDFTRGLLGAKPGSEVAIAVRRDGRELELRPRALSIGSWEVIRRVGLEFEEITYDQDRDLVRGATLAFYEGTPRRQVPPLPVALRVTHVHPESPADDLGVKPGDVLVAVRAYDMFRGLRNVLLGSVDDLADRIRTAAGSEVQVVVLRGDTTLSGRIYVRRN